MNTTVLEVTKEELKTMVETMVEEKLAAIFSDYENDLELADEVKLILARQDERIKNGDRGETLESVLADLELN